MLPDPIELGFLLIAEMAKCGQETLSVLYNSPAIGLTCFAVTPRKTST